MTPSVWMLAQLALIPQVSEKIAEAIVSRYATPTMLVREYDTTPEHLRHKLLSDITYELSSGKTRRIGDKLSARVFEFFHGVE